MSMLREVAYSLPQSAPRDLFRQEDELCANTSNRDPYVLSIPGAGDAEGVMTTVRLRNREGV